MLASPILLISVSKYTIDNLVDQNSKGELFLYHMLTQEEEVARKTHRLVNHHIKALQSISQ